MELRPSRTNEPPAKFTLKVEGLNFTEIEIGRVAEFFSLMGKIGGPGSMLTGFSATAIEIEQDAPDKALERCQEIDGVTVSRDVLEDICDRLERYDPGAEVIEEARRALGL